MQIFLSFLQHPQKNLQFGCRFLNFTLIIFLHHFNNSFLISILLPPSNHLIPSDAHRMLIGCLCRRHRDIKPMKSRHSVYFPLHIREHAKDAAEIIRIAKINRHLHAVIQFYGFHNDNCFMPQRYKKILIYAKKLKKYSRFLQIYLHNSKKSSTFAPAKGLQKQRKLQN